MTLRLLAPADAHELARVICADRNAEEDRKDPRRVFELDRALQATASHEPTDVLVTRSRDAEVACASNERATDFSRGLIRAGETLEQLQEPGVDAGC